jgi:hypothetical protein
MNTSKDPKILAKFELNDEEPSVFSAGGHTHYKIKLFVEDVPEDCLSAVYELHETYRQPVRAVPRGVPGFAEEITSYGDFSVRVGLEGRSASKVITRSLSQALEDYYAAASDTISPAVQNAIAELKKF